MDRRESFIYDGAGLLADAAGSIHIAGPNGTLNQAGWTDQMILSFTDADADGSQSPVLAARNLYGPAVDQIFATEGASGSLLWSLSDHQGTPRDWATRSATTGVTSIAEHVRYTAFGAISSVTDAAGNPLASGLQPPVSFTGQLYDADAGLMYYRARWYDPQLGKFLNDDPMGFAAGDANVSRYVGNAVLTQNDPSGLWTFSISLGIDIHILFVHVQAQVDVAVGFSVDDGLTVGGGGSIGGGIGLGLGAGVGVTGTITNAGSVADLNGPGGIIAVDTPIGGINSVAGYPGRPPYLPSYEPYVPSRGGPPTFQGVGVTAGPTMPIVDIWMGDTQTALIWTTLIPGDGST